MTDDHQPHDLPEINIGDPLYRFLTKHLGFHLRHVIAIMVLFNVAQTLVIPFFHHQSLQSNLLTNLSIKDIQTWLASFVSQPIMLYVYWRSVDVIPNVFVSLHENRVIRPRTGKTAVQFLRDLEARLTSRFNSIVVLVLVLFALVIFNRLGWSTHRYQGPYGSYPYNDFQQYGLMTLHGLLRFTIFGWAIACGLVFIDALRDWWCDFEADVKPLHPDGAGGFSAIGNTTLLSGLIVGASGLFIGSTIVVNVQNRLGSVQLSVLLVGLLLVLLIAPFAFLLPIWSTHVAMLGARNRQLEQLSGRFNALWGTVYDGERVADGERVEQLSNLMQLHEFTLESVPVWPFGGEVFGQYGLSLAPLWTGVLYLLGKFVFPGLLSSVFGGG
jgi:hypothetical protein